MVKHAAGQLALPWSWVGFQILETGGELLASTWAKHWALEKALLETSRVEVNGRSGLLHLTATPGKRLSCRGRSGNGLSYHGAVILVATINKWLGMIDQVTGGEQACHSGKK